MAGFPRERPAACLHPAMPKLFAVALVVTAALCATSAQPVQYVGGEGCANLRPGAPRDLKATSGDGSVTLTWGPPNNGACFDKYVVTATPVDADGDAYRAAQNDAQSTDQTTVTISGLQNGEQYTFKVHATASGFGDGDSATTVAGPGDSCSQQKPGKPINLNAKAVGATWLQVCWDGVDNKACVDEYRVAYVLADQQDFRAAASPQQVSKGGCLNVTSLEQDTSYLMYVVAYDQNFGEGKPATLTASTNSQSTPSPSPSSSPSSSPSPSPSPQLRSVAGFANSLFGDFSNLLGTINEASRQDNASTTATLSSTSDSKAPAAPPRNVPKWQCQKTSGCKPSERLIKTECQNNGCQYVKQKGLCADPKTWGVDYINRVVTQYCGEVCDCTSMTG